MLQIVRERSPTRYGLDPIRDIHVLCPMNRSGVSAQSLNIDLQKGDLPGPAAGCSPAAIPASR